MPMPISYDDYQNGVEYFTFSPVSIERYAQSLQQQYQQQQQQHHGQAVDISTQQQESIQNNSYGKRKHENSGDNFDIKRRHVSHVSGYQQSLTPPQTPGNGNGTGYSQQQYTWPMYQYDLTSPQDNHQGSLRRLLPKNLQESSPPQISGYTNRYQVRTMSLQYPSYVNSNNVTNVNRNISPGLHFLYEKSLNCVRRWRENGLTVQLFYCVVCQLPTDDEERLKTHIETFHSRTVLGGQLHCDKCEEIFNNEDDFLQHTASHHKNSTTCNGCGVEFPNKTSLSSHEPECFECRPYKCEHCAKRFILSARLKHHRQYCSSAPTPPTFTCKVCSKQFHKQDSYLEHVPIHAYM